MAKHTLTYFQLLGLEKDLTNNLTLYLLLTDRVDRLLNATKSQRLAIHARFNKLKEKYVQTDAEGKLLSTKNEKGESEWIFLERVEIDGMVHFGDEVKNAFERETQKFLKENSVIVQL
jgi:hypothetical protein